MYFFKNLFKIFYTPALPCTIPVELISMQFRWFDVVLSKRKSIIDNFMRTFNRDWITFEYLVIILFIYFFLTYRFTSTTRSWLNQLCGQTFELREGFINNSVNPAHALCVYIIKQNFLKKNQVFFYESNDMYSFFFCSTDFSQ